jgi:putative ABC transport system ATP-binding protein
MNLVLEKVHKSYTELEGRDIDVMKEVSFTVEKGECVAIHGPSGCGKSSLLMVTGGLMRPNQGVIKINDTDLYKLGLDDRALFRAKNIGFVFQEFHLVPYLNIRENILVAASDEGDMRELEKRADVLIEKFALSHRVKHLPQALSTGERQRTALARAFLNNPKLILADEPTGNLDTENAEIVLNHLKAFANDGGMVLLATHDNRCAAFADKSFQLSEGQIV